MTTTPDRPIVATRTAVERTLYRVAICAFTYYADKPAEELGYTVHEDVAWCIAPLSQLPDNERTTLSSRIRTLITHPAADRRGFIATLAAMAEEER